MDPVGSLIGSLLIGFGTVILFGALKNRKVFGPGGIVTEALTKGSITNLSNVPQAFPTDVIGKNVVREEGPGKGTGRASKASNLQPVRAALEEITLSDSVLANDIEVRIFMVRSDSSRADLMPLSQLLAIADAKGLSGSTAVIRAYILELSGESV